MTQVKAIRRTEGAYDNSPPRACGVFCRLINKVPRCVKWDNLFRGTGLKTLHLTVA